MSIVKTYDEYVNEGIVSALKYQYRITEVNAFVFDKSAELIEKDPKKYKSAKDTLRDIESEAKKMYEDTMKGLDDILPFHKWWSEFSKKFIQLQDLEEK